MTYVSLQLELLRVVSRNDVHSLRHLTERLYKINERLSFDRTPLHVAAQHGSIDAALFLIEQGAVIDAGDENGRTPLHEAADGGRTQTALALVQRGANINIKTVMGLTPLHEAAGSGRAETVIALLEAGCDIEAKNNTGVTALRMATDDQQELVALALIAFGADKRNCTSVALGGYDQVVDYTMCQAAAQGGFLDRLKVLLASGSTALEDQPEKLVSLALRSQKMDAVAFLQSLIAVNAIDDMLLKPSLMPLT